MPPSLTLMLVAKPPRAGQVKTRLGATIGAENAAQFAAAFLVDVAEQLVRVAAAHGARVVLLTTDPEHDHGVDIAQRWSQGDGDLGARLGRGFARADGPCIAVGADAPGLPDAVLHAAITALQTAEATLSPAADGGYVLLGLGAWRDGWLDDLPWSSADTFAATHARLSAHGLRVATVHGPLAGGWPDVDTEADLRWVLANVARESAPETFALADRLCFGASVGPQT